MIIKTEELKSICGKILSAVDSNALSEITETLEMITKDGVLYLNVTNREYYVSIKLNITDNCDFHATVNANLFLKLISQMTTDDIELTTTDKSLIVNGNGEYNLPMIYDGDELLELPRINIENRTSEFKIGTNILRSILNYNSKEIEKDIMMKPVQRLYYIDEQGAITFNTSACVNNFTLEQPIRILLNNKIVKLFKLFDCDNVDFVLGHDALSNDIIQTKVSFSSDNISLTAVISCDDSLLNSVPATNIRKIANNEYNYVAIFNKSTLLQAIDRMLLFIGNKDKAYFKFEFNNNSVTISNKNSNTETIKYENDSNVTSNYTNYLNLRDVKSVLSVCVEQYVTMCFGDNRSITIKRDNVVNVIPEIRV